MAGEESLASCADCGATIYPEHLEKRVAEHWEGRLLCPFCLKDKRAESAAGTMPEQEGGGIPLVDLPGKLADTPIQYDAKPTVIPTAVARVGEFASQSSRRPLLPDSSNATRCRIFHCKLADGPIAHMCEQINEWADADDEIQIKFATSTIGVVEGKHMDAHLIVSVFY
jgi:hypothetical protein